MGNKFLNCFALTISIIGALNWGLIGFFNLTDPEAYSSARSYMLITCGLIIFSFLNLTLTGLFTAQGDSRSPLMANFLGLVGNMLLDPLLILGIGPFPRLETAGAAIATVTAQFLVFAVLVFRIFTLLYTPCVAAIAAVKRELGGGRAALGVVLMQCGIAWVVAFAVHCVGVLLGLA